MREVVDMVYIGGVSYYAPMNLVFLTKRFGVVVECFTSRIVGLIPHVVEMLFRQIYSQK